jgi:hypothetical protein
MYVELPSEAELASSAAKAQVVAVQGKLRRVGGTWSGLARWTASHVTAEGKRVMAPSGDAIDRLDRDTSALDVDPSALEATLQKHLDDAIK